MVYKSTEAMVQRVRPLLERLAAEPIDRARLLQYLSARSGIDWGVFTLVREERLPEAPPAATTRLLIVRDRYSGDEHAISYPACLPEALDQLVIDEYKRLAIDRPLTTMNTGLFDALFRERYCNRCRWRGPEHAQIHHECHYAGHPVNFEPASSQT
jgi:hypothetical protein